MKSIKWSPERNIWNSPDFMDFPFILCSSCCCNFWVIYFLLLTVSHVDSSQMSSCGKRWTGVWASWNSAWRHRNPLQSRVSIEVKKSSLLGAALAEMQGQSQQGALTCVLFLLCCSWGSSQGNQDAAQWQGSTGEEASAHEIHVWRLQEEDAGRAVQRAEAYGNR